MKKKEGILYGVGVGPGDPELMTAKAIRILKSADVIAIPRSDKNIHTAYGIVLGAMPKLKSKERFFLDFPMTRNVLKRELALSANVRKITEYLDKNKTVAFPVLGDPTVYSSYTYVSQSLQDLGYHTETIPGVTSFCAAAAAAGESLAEDSTPIHIIPALRRREDVYPTSFVGGDIPADDLTAPDPPGPTDEFISQKELSDLLSLPGRKVLMKGGRYSGKIRDELLAKNISGIMIENCGMLDEKIHRSVKDFPDQASYYSIILIDPKEEESRDRRPRRPRG